MYKFPLPPHTTFTSKKYEKSPLDKFYAWLMDYLPHKNDALFNSLFTKEDSIRIDVTKVILCEKDFEVIEKKQRAWCKKKWPYLSERRLQSEIQFEFLCHAPKVIRKKDSPETFVPGFVYIELDYLTNKE